MHEMMLTNSVKTGGTPIGVTLSLIKSGSGSNLNIVVGGFTGEITFDVAGSQIFSTGDSATFIAVNVPANAEKLYINMSDTSSEAIIPSFSTDTNTKINGVESWPQTDTDIIFKLYNCRELISVPLTSPSWSDYSQLFFGCNKFNQDISTWDTGHVVKMEDTFNGCTVFNKPLGTWNVDNVTDIRQMFISCSQFNQNLSNLTFPKVTVANRLNYAFQANAWLAQNRPNFAIKT